MREHRKPGRADKYDDYRADKHRRHRGKKALVPAQFGKGTRDEGSSGKCNQVTASWSKKMGQSARASGEKRQPHRSFNQVSNQCCGTEPRSEQCSSQKYGKGLTGNRLGSNRYRDLRRQCVEQTKSENQTNGARPIERSKGSADQCVGFSVRSIHVGTLVFGLRS